MTEFEPNPLPQIAEFSLPEDEHWDDIDSVPHELRRVVDVYAGALQDDASATTGHTSSLEKFYEVYDQLAGQTCVVARLKNEIVGVASFDFTRKQPFIDGFAVDNEARGTGIATALLQHLLAAAKRQGVTELHARSQPSALEINRKLLAGCGLQYQIDDVQSYPLITIYLE